MSTVAFDFGVLYNQTTSRAADVDFLESICTTLEFHIVSIPASRGLVTRAGRAGMVLRDFTWSGERHG